MTKFRNPAGRVATYASNLGCADDYADQTSSIGEASDTIAEYAVLISEQIGDLPRQLAKMSDRVSENGDEYVNWAGLALAALGVLYAGESSRRSQHLDANNQSVATDEPSFQTVIRFYDFDMAPLAVFGIIGTLCFEGKNHPIRCASGFLAFTNAFGVLMLIIIAILLAAELTAGIVLGDFCAADDGPSNALVSVMQSQTDDDNEVIYSQRASQFQIQWNGSTPSSGRDPFIHSVLRAVNPSSVVLTSS